MESAISSLTSRIEKLSTRLESVEHKLAQGPPAAAAGAPAPAAAGAAPDAGEVSPAQRDFDELVASQIRPLIPLCDTLAAPILKEQLGVFVQALEEQSKLIGAASRSKKPSPDQLPKALEKLSALMGKVSEYKDKNGRAKEFNNIAAVAEGVAALGWIAVEPTPAPFMNDVIPGSEFYSNRVLTANKGKDENQVKWAKDFNGFLRNLQAYVKKSHTTGLTFNPRGGDFLEAARSGAAAAPAGGCCPPPPPPPPAAPLYEQAAPAAAAPKGADIAAVFGQLNQGTEITKGLKKVTSDMKTKNRPAEERCSVVHEVAPKAEPKKAAAAVEKKVKPPVKVLNGTKWSIENHVDAQITISESEVERNHAFYIGNCKNTTVVIKGKVNSITLDNCLKTGLVFDTVVAVVELVNSNSCQMQVLGKAPSVNIDKCNGIQVFLSKDCISEPSTSVYTSKCSSCNVLIPGATADADPTESAIPEQLISVVKNGKLITELASSHGF